MEPRPSSYCEAVAQMDSTNVHRVYHDTAYGFPIEDDNELFERLILEINQAGLSWTTILKKQQNFKAAYDNFAVAKVAAYNDDERQRLMSDPGIVRNRLKIDAAIHNAKVVLTLQETFGSFAKWLAHHHPKSKEEWMKVFKNTFRFTGGEIVNEFLMSIGYLPGSHIPDCPTYKKVIASKPPWIRQ